VASGPAGADLSTGVYFCGRRWPLKWVMLNESITAAVTLDGLNELMPPTMPAVLGRGCLPSGSIPRYSAIPVQALRTWSRRAALKGL
jgi:hypothetical protein